MYTGASRLSTALTIPCYRDIKFKCVFTECWRSDRKSFLVGPQLQQCDPFPPLTFPPVKRALYSNTDWTDVDSVKMRRKCTEFMWLISKKSCFILWRCIAPFLTFWNLNRVFFPEFSWCANCGIRAGWSGPKMACLVVLKGNVRKETQFATFPSLVLHWSNKNMEPDHF